MITGIGSYGPTMTAFSVNWQASNGELTPQAVLLAGQYSRATFDTDRAQVLTLIDNAATYAENARVAEGARDSLKNLISTRGKQLRGSVMSQIVDAQVLKDLPTLPKSNGNYALFTDPFKSMSRLWSRINSNAADLGLAGPLLLQGGYTQQQFVADLDTLTSLYNNAQSADESLADARGRRNNAMDAIYTRMKQYRAAAPAMLPANSPALANLPRLLPEAGTTPPGLVVTGDWDAVLGKAVFDWPLSTFKNLDKLQARGCTGPLYKADEEEVIADLAATATHFETDWGLSAPGARICVKVYVMATTGNENGGKAVKIVRPET